MIVGMGFRCQSRRSSSPFLFGSFSFVGGCGYVGSFALPPLLFLTSQCEIMRREAELLATEGPWNPVPKMTPASLPPWLPLKTVDYLGPKLELRKSGQAATYCDKEIVT